MDADVIVIGAGLAGLTAARALERSGHSVVVLEGRDRVGGRVRNVQLADGSPLEIGGQWAGPTQHRILALADELGVATYPTHVTGDNVIEYRGRLVRYRGTIPRLNAAALADVGQAQLRLDRLAKRVPTDAPWAAPRAVALDGQSFATWLRRNTVTRGARQLLALSIAAVWACEPEDVSLLHVLFYIHSAGSFDALVGTEGHAQDRRFVGGSAVIAERLAAQLRDVRLASTVTRIAQDADGVAVEVARDAEVASGADGAPGAGGAVDTRLGSPADPVRARHVVVALAPALAGRLRYEPPLPADRDQLTQRTPNGSVIKAMCAYPEPFWRADGLSGQAAATDGPVRVVFDNSPHGSARGVLVGFFEGRQAREWSPRTPAERSAILTATFVRLFGQRAAEPDEYVECDWSAEELTRGCYGAHLPPGAWTAFGPALKRPAGRIHWAGTETAGTWSGYMDGALESGERAAAEVVARMGLRQAQFG